MDGPFHMLKTQVLVRKPERKKYHLKDKGMNGWITLKSVLNEYYENVDWIHLTQERDQRQALVNLVMKI
jgi:hypothetical protein